MSEWVSTLNRHSKISSLPMSLFNFLTLCFFAVLTLSNSYFVYLDNVKITYLGKTYSNCTGSVNADSIPLPSTKPKKECENSVTFANGAITGLKCSKPQLPRSSSGALQFRKMGNSRTKVSSNGTLKVDKSRVGNGHLGKPEFCRLKD